ncbi:nuclear transport factor 2 family protein [Rubrivirga sp.]|uniref:nuclear transport factor 2 family protein n=1 Tax=Rubrivirga sp. TaxID=1885344 RepID=UPI003C774BE8
MSPSDFLTKHVAAISSGDLEAVLDLYAADASLVSFEWDAQGREAIKERFSDFFEFHGEIASVEVRYRRTTDDAAFAMYAVDGGRGTFEIVNAFVLEDGACTRHFSNEVGADLDRDQVEGD